MIRVELISKGLGLLLQGCFGTGVSTLVAGSTYQQLYSLLRATLSMQSYTIQCGIVDSTATVRPHTFAGCTVSDFSITFPENGIAVLEVTFTTLRAPDTATALTAAVMVTQTATSPVLYEARDASMTIGGTLVVPTATVLSSGGTSVAYMRSCALNVNNNLGMRPNMGAYGQPTTGLRSATLSGVFEWTDNVLRDAFYAQSEVPITLRATLPEALSVGFATFEFAAPAVKLNSGVQPSPTDGTLVAPSFEGEILEPAASNIALYAALRTADIAL